MKYLCSLLAIIILALSCIPCSDAESFAVSRSQVQTTQQETTANHNSSRQEHKDECSPFCQCSCCAGAYALPWTVMPVQAALFSLPGKVFALHHQQCPVGIALPVWQPPQLV